MQTLKVLSRLEGGVFRVAREHRGACFDSFHDGLLADGQGDGNTEIGDPIPEYDTLLQVGSLVWVPLLGSPRVFDRQESKLHVAAAGCDRSPKLAVPLGV